jgi:hypothetical protein
VRSERSGLIESPGVWFFRGILRSHGYDHVTLCPMLGKQVTPTSWLLGDFVIPFSRLLGKNEPLGEESCFRGRIVTDNNLPTDGASEDCLVNVEYTHPCFAEAVGLDLPACEPFAGVETRPIAVSKLAHFGWRPPKFSGSICQGSNSPGELFHGLSEEPIRSISQRLLSEVAAIGLLDRSAVESLGKECGQNSEMLPLLFSAGLPNTVLHALDEIEKQIKDAEPREDLPDRVSAMKSLVTLLSEYLFDRKGRRPGWSEVDSCSGDPTHRAHSEKVTGQLSVFLHLMSKGQLVKSMSLGERGNHVSTPGQANELCDEQDDLIRFDDEDSKTFLGSIGRFSHMHVGNQSSNLKDSSVNISFVSHLVSCGLLTDDFRWFKSSLAAKMEKDEQPAARRPSCFLKSANDEEGSSLLFLSIAFGCSLDIVTCLLEHGAQPSLKDIEAAALTDQPHTLLLLLRHSSICLQALQMSRYSESVKTIFEHMHAQQKQLDSRMRQEAGPFMSRLFKNIVACALSARRCRSPRIDACSKTLSELLVGNVLLGALERTQHFLSARKGSLHERTSKVGIDSADREQEKEFASQSLVDRLPSPVLNEALLKVENDVSVLLLLIEDFLMSKDLSDSASGLALLSTTMKRLPDVLHSAKFAGYGMPGLVSLHESLASSRLESLIARYSDGPDANDDIPCPLICCPKKHTAALHITRHSSFRCDLCGSGIDRGRPMHGCRECDWDACEACTDKAESGVIKCYAIKKLAQECKGLFVDNRGDDSVSCDPELSGVLAHLADRDVESARNLGAMLATPGVVTMHQFVSYVLPSLHNVLLGRNLEIAPSAQILKDKSGHQSKKLRVGAGAYGLTPVSSLLSGGDGVKVTRDLARAIVDAKVPSLLDVKKVKAEAFFFSRVNPDLEERKRCEEFDSSIKSSELVRRLHQVLSFYERLPCDETSKKLKDAGAAIPPGSELQALTKPIELHLFSSSADGCPPFTMKELRVDVEPMVSARDLETFILKNSAVGHSGYAEYCQRFVQMITC